MEKKSLIGNNLDDLNSIIQELSGNSVHAQKLSRWIYRKRVSSLSQVNDIPKSTIDRLLNQFEIGIYSAIETIEGSDDSVKFLYQNKENQLFESVLMKSDKRTTLCVSSQSGCRMGCKFCMTGSIGFKGNLKARDIVNQLLAVPNSKSINRIVIMGMGEPFDNSEEVLKSLQILTADWGCAFGKSKITLSSVGILNELEVFLKNPACNLAISLHSPFPVERQELMPIERTNPIKEVISLIKNHPLPKPLRISFEYVALGGINLTDKHAMAIAELLEGIQCHLNIIPWNSHENAQYNSPKKEELQKFILQLNSLGILTPIRKSMAAEIGAACGQMAGRKKSD